MTREEMAECVRRNEEEVARINSEYARMSREYEATCRQAALEAQLVVVRSHAETSAMLAKRLAQKRITVAI